MVTPLTQKAVNIRRALAEEWKAGRISQTRGDLTLTLIRQSQYVLGKGQGNLVGIDAWVRLSHEELGEIPVDQHRRFINPPIYVTENVAPLIPSVFVTYSLSYSLTLSAWIS